MTIEYDWDRASAAIAEGFCGDCLGRLDAARDFSGLPLEVGETAVGECRPCHLVWSRSDDGAPLWLGMCTCAECAL
jgi:hypothetical protein